MPDKLVLTYFNYRGKAEISRWIMAQGEIPYEDNRIEDGPEWEKLKPSILTGCLPMLEVNGVQIYQSLAIARFLAVRSKLCGKDDLEAAKADTVVLQMNDVYDRYVQVKYLESNEEAKAEKYKWFLNDVLPKNIKILEKLLLANGGDWFVGNEVTWADLAVADFFDETALEFRAPQFDLRSTSKVIADHVDKVKNLPKIKKWLEERPQTVG